MSPKCDSSKRDGNVRRSSTASEPWAVYKAGDGIAARISQTSALLAFAPNFRRRSCESIFITKHFPDWSACIE